MRSDDFTRKYQRHPWWRIVGLSAGTSIVPTCRTLKAFHVPTSGRRGVGASLRWVTHSQNVSRVVRVAELGNCDIYVQELPASGFWLLISNIDWADKLALVLSDCPKPKGAKRSL